MVSSCIASNRQQYHEYKHEYKWEYKRNTFIPTNVSGRGVQLRRSLVSQPQRIEVLDLVRGLDAWP